MKLLVIALLFSSSAVFATETKAEKDYEIVPAKKSIEQDSSEFHRLEKKYQLTAILTGVGPSMTSTTGLQAGYFLDRDKLILLELTSGSLTSNSSSSSISYTIGSELKVKSNSFGVHYKQFTSNSFYYRFGADFRTVSYNYSYDSSFSTDRRKFDGQSLAANFQIGNQWQWENFTLGCDWVGISLPLTGSTSNREVTSTSDFTNEDKRTTDDEDYLVHRSQLNLLHFYLGASF